MSIRIVGPIYGEKFPADSLDVWFLISGLLYLQNKLLQS